MAQTAVPNSPAIVLQPTGPASPTALNPFYQACDPTNGNYATATGRDLFTFYLYPATSAPTWLATSNFTVGSVVNFGGEVDTITNIAITTNVLTVTATNTFTVGAEVKLTGLTTATFLNNVTVVVTSSTGTTFLATFAHGDYASASDSGSATNAAGVFIAIANSGPGYSGAKQPNTPAFWSAYVDSEATITIFSAPDACTGRKSDVDDYSVPLGAGSVEFLVLPSSVFTQANGQIQFQASSNLVSVYVRNL